MIFAFIYIYSLRHLQCRVFFPFFFFLLFFCLFVCLLVSFHLSFYEREGLIRKKHFTVMSENSCVTFLSNLIAGYLTRFFSEVAFISN